MQYVRVFLMHPLLVSGYGWDMGIIVIEYVYIVAGLVYECYTYTNLVQ